MPEAKIVKKKVIDNKATGIWASLLLESELAKAVIFGVFRVERRLCGAV